MQVTLKQLMEVLDAYKGTVIVSCLTRTEPKLLKKSRVSGTPTEVAYPGGVVRIAYGRFMLATNYEANVNAQREREGHPEAGEFQAESLWGGKGARNRQFSRFLVIHKDKENTFYIRMRPHSDEVGCPLKMEDKWTLADGTPLTSEQLATLKSEYMSAPSKSKKQEVEKEIPYRAYNTDGLMAMAVGGNVYEIVPGETPEWGE
jgi:hypothetical protein